MGLRAKKDFPEIEFSKSVIIGDLISDMYGVRIETWNEKYLL
jgi:hypothetical protein